MAHRSARPIHRWRVPPNWSARDWQKEMEAVVSSAICEAQRDFDPMRGVPMEDFVRQRVLARALSHHRREWAYARRCGPHVEDDDCEDSNAPRLDSVDASDALQSYLGRLTEPERRLIEGLYWEEKTEAELARIFSLTQSAISKRKRRALDQLRHWIDGQEKAAFLRIRGINR